MVALAVTAAAAVFLAGACNTGAKISAQSSARATMLRAAESKLEEWSLGAERKSRGDLDGDAGSRWEIRSAGLAIGPLDGLERVTLTLWSSDGRKTLELVTLRRRP
jgi:hypothetical protein